MRGSNYTRAGRPMTKGLVLLGILQALWLTGSPAGLLAADSAARPKATLPGSPEAGRSIFNGKGVCFYCHGIDGDRHRLPRLERETAALIARLSPPPADLRNPKGLRLTTDEARAKAIREGHPGTGMFPDTTMTDQELADTLAYLAVLRRGAPSR